MKKILLIIATVVLIISVFRSTYFKENYYKGKISRTETVKVEIGAELDTYLLEDQVIEMKELLTNADWKKTKHDLSTTSHMEFDDLLVDILDVSKNELMIEIGRHHFLLSDVERNIYSIIFNEEISN